MSDTRSDLESDIDIQNEEESKQNNKIKHARYYFE